LTTRFCELGRSGKIVHKTWLVHKIGIDKEHCQNMPKWATLIY